uniref:DMT family transporter n=1 Tax=Litchfieldia alkalitelluris TaxID=304268 RepID=UPI001F2C3728|nr:DMT family transporter [Litchfieldia alkalitelluris]
MQSKYYVLLLLTSFLWGGNFVAGKFLVNHASPLFLTELRWIIALICLIPIVLYFDRSLRFPRAALVPLVLMGLTGVLLFNVLMFIALKYTTADNVGLLSTLNPISIAIASFCFYREKLSKSQLAGMMISFAGIFVVISHGDIYRLVNFHFNIGDLFMLGAVAIWGLYSVVAKKAMRYVSPYKATLWSAIFGVIMISPFIINDHTISSPTPSFWIAALYSSIGATVLAMIFWNIGVQKVGGTKSGMFLNFNPIFTAILAFIFLGEKLTLTQFIGSIVVILGVYIFTAPKKSFLKIPTTKARTH